MSSRRSEETEETCKLDKDRRHSRGHDGEGGDDDLVEDVGDDEGGAHDHGVGEGEDEDCGGGRPPEALLEPSLLLVQGNAVWNVSSVSWSPCLL